MTSSIVALSVINDYPFGFNQDSHPTQPVQVKKSLDYSSQPRFVMKEKIRMLKNIGSPHLVALQSTAEAENTLNLIFEYVHKKLENELWSLDSEIIERLQRDFLALAQNLGNHYIIHDFRLDNVGLSRHNDLKYFLGFAFKIDKASNKKQLVERYQKTVRAFFAEGGRFNRVQSPFKPSKQEYTSTMDSCCKVNHNFDDNKEALSREGRLAMKKSATVLQNSNPFLKSEFLPLDNKRFSLNCDNKIVVPRRTEPEERREERTNDLKVVKIEELGARINNLKRYMKNLTGATPTNSGEVSHMMVRIDANNSDNRTYMENKLMITPNYTKFEKKIAEFRESKFFRAYGEREILCNNNNIAYELRSTTKVANPNCEKQPQLAIEGSVQPPVVAALQSPKSAMNKKIPHYLLQKKQQSTQDSKKKNDTSLNSSKTNPKEQQLKKQYQKLGIIDKYCDEFMHFLEDEPINPTNDTKSCDSAPSNIQALTKRLIDSEQKQISERLQSNGSKSTSQIQNKVKNAIRNSIKLINGIKLRESTNIE